jgi:peptidoglycan/xylan/chitin deacetylase (PgdA/CDA1 family)
MPVRLSAIVLAFGPDQAVDDALASIVRQSAPPGELIVVHEGDENLARRRARLHARGLETLFVRVGPATPGAARNAGVRRSTGDAVLVVEAGVLPSARFMEAAATALSDEHRPAFVTALSGFAPRAPAEPGAEDEAPAPAAMPDLLASPFGVSGGGLFERRAFDACGGFDESLPALVEWDLLIALLETGRHGLLLPTSLAAWRPDGLPAARSFRPERHLPAVRQIFVKHRACFERHAAEVLTARERIAKALWDREHALLQRRERLRAELASTVAEVEWLRGALRPYGRDTTEWNDLRRTTPVSRYWGMDRGRPVDRHYIEGFMARHAADIRGDVLEVLDPGLTTLGGSRVERSDVLDIDADNHRATVIADLRAADGIPSESYDCFILTQTLHLIDDVRSALSHACRVLRPGGVLLATLPSVSMAAVEYGPRGDYWRVTAAGARHLFEEVFPAANLEVSARGNILAATAFLQGLSCEDVDPADLDVDDPAYPVVVTVRAVKPGARAVACSGPRRDSAILLYHRVAELAHDVHRLATPPEAFRRQMEALVRDWHPMPLAELAAASARGDTPDGAVAVTFDDGYLDNLEQALPILEEFAVPAAFFLPGEALLHPRDFWWDVLERVWLTGRTLPPAVDLRIDGAPRAFQARDEGERRASHDALHAILSTSLPAVRDDLLRQLARVGGEDATLPPRSRMTADDVRRLASSPLVEIGAHGLHHLSLGALPREQVFREVFESRSALERILGREIHAFAYPHGDVPEGALAAVRAAGYRAAVTCDARRLRRREDPLGLPRLEPGMFFTPFRQ